MTFALQSLTTNLGEEQSTGFAVGSAGSVRRLRQLGTKRFVEEHPFTDRTDGRPTICIDRAGFRRADHASDKDGRCVFCS